MGALQALVTIVGLIGILALLLLSLCRYLGGWTRTRTWLTSSREEKMVLTRATGQFHPNGFMIRSESDLNLSGRGSFRRFDKTAEDYQLLRQGSIVSIRSNQQSIPPQPLRPAPSLPAASSVVVPAPAPAIHSQLEQQNSTDSVFTRTDSGRSHQQQRINIDNSMPPPRIPPPPPNNSVSSSNNSSSNTPRSLPSFSMTNPFLPLLQASTQFFSQTLEGLQNFQQRNSLSRGGSLETSQDDPFVEGDSVLVQEETPAGYAAMASTAPVRPTSIHSSSSSARSGMSMGELLFSASPSVTTEMSKSRIANPPPPAPCEFFNSSDYSHVRVTGGTTSSRTRRSNPSQQDSTCSNPFSPPPVATHPPPVAPSVTSDDSVVSQETFSWASKPEGAKVDSYNYETSSAVTNSKPLTSSVAARVTNSVAAGVTNSEPVGVANSKPVEVANSEPVVTSSAAVGVTNSAATDVPNPTASEITNSAATEVTNSAPKEVRNSSGVGNSGASEVTNLGAKEEAGSIFEQIRDFNEMSFNKNLESERMDAVKSRTARTTSASSHFLPPSMTTVESVRKSIQISNFTNSGRLSHMKQSSLDSALDSSRTKIFVPSSLTNVTTTGGGTDNRDPLKIMNSSGAILSSGHYSCFPSYRNARSFSLRQASTDSIGSESDLGSPLDGSLPSLQRAMSCDSVCSDTSVVLGELDQSQLTGHLCVGLEYDSETADLLVNVMEAKEINGLHPDPSTPFDSYVRVYLLPDKTTNMQTRVYRKSLNPIYKEKFMFGLETAELPIRSLMFYMYATDKYSNTLIGEAELKLRDVDVHQLPLTTWLPLTDSGQRGGDFGEIMFSLSYLPTAERLTVVIVKGRNLKFPRDNVGDPFVKVYLLQRGKKVSKKKSSTKRGEKNPIFNEAMIFGVPAHALQSIQLRITVADCSDSDGNRAYSVGHVIVGSMSTGKPLSHWNQMLSSLRKPIAMWHSLRK